MSTPDMAFVQDWLVDFGGAERCLEALCSEYPSAPIHTLFYDSRQFSDSAIGAHAIQTSFLDRPFFKKRYRVFLALYPLAIEQLDIGSPEVVVSFSHSVAHGAMVRADTLHICYCHTPVRYAWDLYHSYLRLSGLTSGPKSWAARAILHYLRMWDAGAAGRVDRWVANSRNVARRILRVYGKEAAVIYPPVEVGRFAPARERGDAFLVVGRMVPYKRADLAVVACTRVGLPLRVVGDGPEMSKLRRLAGPTIQFMGRLDDGAVAEEMARARALLFCGEEDFGITPVEAQAAGTPVIAYGKGGALETVSAPEKGDYGKATGLFFREPTAESLAEAMVEFDNNAHRFSRAAAVRNAARFDTRRFVNEMKALVESEWEAFRGRH
jgi:glycosyltransferase involved in cell wall biosynthesis